ncbi:mRNA splicing protein Yju2 [Aspergillus arachidicola]|uniref:mRNA splicing protein Yju2 n=1 Tax=Aspergillus arachidicola TaxID=656916 RepID=A0A2G7ELJ0_9EURO|nr:mRNA splicing protein Yju2 [Aspergillus arachidicola]
MSERKVLSKYYPPDFDPSTITRTKNKQTGPKVITVRLMAPFSWRDYIQDGPEEHGLHGGEGREAEFRAWRDPKNETYNETEEQLLDRLEKEENEEHERAERDKMAELEEKMLDSKREMAIADALDEIRTRNARIERNEALGDETALAHVREEVDEDKLKAEKEIEEAARRAFTTETGEKVKRLVEEDFSNGATPDPKPSDAPPSFARVKKAKKPLPNSLGIKKKAKPSLV